MSDSRPACHRWVALALFLFTASAVAAAETETQHWISALDRQLVTRRGDWTEGRFRYGAVDHLHSVAGGAALEVKFSGCAIAVRLGGQQIPAYGRASTGRLNFSVDGGTRGRLDCLDAPREVVLARGLAPGAHRLRIEHATHGQMAGCRVEGFWIWSEPRGELTFTVSGEKNGYLVDLRTVVRQRGEPIRSTLSRNWLTGRCGLAGLPPGEDYSLEVQAAGWKPSRIDAITILPGRATALGPLFLLRDESTVLHRFRFPALNRAAIRRPGESFRARFLGFDAVIDRVELTRRVGPAVISRRLPFQEDRAAAYYYDREVVAELPADLPPGVYDLSVAVTGGRRTGVCRSPRSVHVIERYPVDPVLVTFGHLDTSGQYQAEYLRRLVSISNVIAPDLVLNSNAVNPAYISGAMSGLEAPYLINFGNHQFPGHEAWYGDPVNLLDLGPDLCVLNFGHPWHADRTRAAALLASRADRGTKIIHAFEANAPLALLDRHAVSMIHDAHGTGVKVADLGSTPTRRIGKSNAASFRVVRFQQGRVKSCTYDGHPTAPYPLPREAASPLRVTFSAPNDGARRSLVATITNDYVESFPRGRLTFVMPAGRYRTTHGEIEQTIDSDDGRYSVVTVRIDIPARQQVRARVEPDRG